MGIKAKIILSIVVFFLLIAIATSFNFIIIGFAPSLATFVLAILSIGAFLLGAGAVLPKDGRAGLSTMVIGVSLGILAVLSAFTISNA